MTQFVPVEVAITTAYFTGIVVGFASGLVYCMWYAQVLEDDAS